MPENQTTNKYWKRRIRSWMRSPQFYVQKAKEKVFGIDVRFYEKPRDLFAAGSFEWLALTENHYGGFQLSGVSSKTHRGGDRMSPHYHGYGRCYAEFLKPYLSAPSAGPKILVEVGILNGSGLAIWCDLFPSARVIGLDINLSNFQTNRGSLQKLGAFQKNVPEVYSFDQLDPCKAGNALRDVLSESRIDIAIDDGCHSIESIDITFESIRPFLANRFIYFIEDNYDSYDRLANRHREYFWTTRGEITVAKTRGY